MSNRILKREESWNYVKDASVNNPADFDEPESGSHLKILIVGDSHSKDMFNALYLNRQELTGLDLRQLILDDYCLELFGTSITLKGEVKTECETQVNRFRESNLTRQADIILYSTRWSKQGIRALPAFLDYSAGATDAKLVLAGRTAEFVDVPKLALFKGVSNDTGQVMASYRNQKIDQLNENIKSIATARQLIYLDKYPVICNPDLTACDGTDAAGNLLFFDYGHWTLTGAQYFGKKMMKVGFLAPLGI